MNTSRIGEKWNDRSHQGKGGRGAWRPWPCLCLGVVALMLSGCISDEIQETSPIASYQRTLVSDETPQRADGEETDANEPLGLLTPVSSASDALPKLDISVDPNTGGKTIQLTVEQAMYGALAGSPEIRVVSFDPAIAREELTQAAGEFDPVVFSQLNYEDQDNPVNSTFAPGQSETRLLESGLKQRLSTGAEWSASYALTRTWDDLVGRTLPTRYEPVLAFRLRQPLLRDAGRQINLAGVNIARINHRVALLGFRRKAEDVSTDVLRTYWQLVRARRDLEIQRQLIERTEETVIKVEGRKDIDATGVHIRQARSYAKSREGVLLNVQKRVDDAQDELVRRIAMSGLHLASDVEVVPVTAPWTNEEEIERPVTDDQALVLAMQHNPGILQARAAVEIAEINVRVARRQKMPRLDLVASASTQGLARDFDDASDELGRDYNSYAAGIMMEFPLGNRQRKAELVKRRLERRRASAVLHNVADQVAVQVKERLRKVGTNLDEIRVQRQAVEEGQVYLEALQDTELIREELTAEFLLVKLQAQETLAQAQRAENEAVTQFNIALAELAQATGTVLDLHRIEASLSAIVSTE